MSTIEFIQAEKDILANKIKADMAKELDIEIGQFDAEFMLEFFSKEIGGYHYNKGLKDAQGIFLNRVDTITDAIYELEVPTEFSGR